MNFIQLLFGVALAFAPVQPELPPQTLYDQNAVIDYLKACKNDSQCPDNFIANLAWCESRFKPEIRILDSNNKYSYSLFQFQLDTFLSQGIKYGVLPKDIEREEALNLIYDPETQLTLARFMIADKKYGDWKICSQLIKK